MINIDHLNTFLHRRLHEGCGFVETGEQQPTLEATRFGLEAALRAGLSLGIEVQVRDWVRSLWRSEGGFAARSESAIPDLASTYYATRLLIITRARGLLDDNATLRHWLQAQWRTENQTVDALYYLMRTVDLLEIPVEGNMLAEWLEFLRNCRGASGGFGNIPGASGDIEHTYCTVQLLLAHGVGAPESIQGWVGQCMQPDGWMTWSPTDSRHSYATLYWGSHAALALNAPCRWEHILGLIGKAQNGDGGIGLDGSSLWHTYCAISAQVIAEIGLDRRPRSDLVLE